jgi:hypothetical protein
MRQRYVKLTSDADALAVQLAALDKQEGGKQYNGRGRKNRNSWGKQGGEEGQGGRRQG